MAVVMPYGKQQFLDAAGVSLALGSVTFYIPNTTTPKDTWQDEGQTILNTNPVQLDLSGSAIIFGSGAYRQIVKDFLGNVIWDRSVDAIDPVAQFAGTGGSSLIGWIQAGTGAVARTVQAKLREYLPTAQDRGAPTDGTTDARAAIALADAAGPFSLQPGLYLVASSLTITNDIRVEKGARFVIPAGVTLTFNGRIFADDYQIFNITSTGAVAGLLDVNAMWFVGDAWNNPARVDGRALAQRAYDACAQPTSGGAVVRWPEGFMKHDGVAITVTKGQATIGSGYSKTIFLWSTTLTAGFQATTTTGASFSSIGCSWGDYRLLPTAGTFLDIQIFGCTITNIFCGVSYNAISYSNGGTGNITDSFLYESFNTGLFCQNTSDVFFNNLIINTNLAYVTVGTITGAFIPGEQVKGGTSNAQGPLSQIDSSILRVGYTNASCPQYQVGETITGQTSGAHAVISATQVPHAAGGIRLTDRCEAIVGQTCDVIGGQYSMFTDATTNVHGSRPAYCKFSSIYFDSAINGSVHNNSSEFDFVACWWSNRPGTAGAVFTNSDGFKFLGGGPINCGKDGFVYNATCNNFSWQGVSFRGNSQLSPGNFSGLRIRAGALQFTVVGCIGTDANLGLGTQKFAVEIETGGSDQYSVAHNRFTASQVSDGGTGSNKFVGNNY